MLKHPLELQCVDKLITRTIYNQINFFQTPNDIALYIPHASTTHWLHFPLFYKHQQFPNTNTITSGIVKTIEVMLNSEHIILAIYTLHQRCKKSLTYINSKKFTHTKYLQTQTRQRAVVHKILAIWIFRERKIFQIKRHPRYIII